MTSEIVPGVYQLKVPIPDNPLGWVLPYLIEGDGGWTMIDCGWDAPEAFEALERQVDDVIASLRRLARIPVRKALPAHEYAFDDLPGRLREIEQHHQARLQEMLDIIDGLLTTAYQVAKHTAWTIGSFDQFSKWMQRTALLSG